MVRSQCLFLFEPEGRTVTFETRISCPLGCNEKRGKTRFMQPGVVRFALPSFAAFDPCPFARPYFLTFFFFLLQSGRTLTECLVGRVVPCFTLYTRMERADLKRISAWLKVSPVSFKLRSPPCTCSFFFEARRVGHQRSLARRSDLRSTAVPKPLHGILTNGCERKEKR